MNALLQNFLRLLGVLWTGRTILFQRRLLVFVVTYLGYMCILTLRKPFSVVKSTVTRELNVSSYGLGTIDSSYLIMYAFGQFCIPKALDTYMRGNVRLPVLICFLGASLSCAFFGLAGTANSFRLFWGLNGLFNAPVYPLMMKVVSLSTTSDTRASIIGLWSTCQHLGNMMATLYAVMTLEYFGWRTVFQLAPTACIIIGLFMYHLNLLDAHNVSSRKMGDMDISDHASAPTKDSSSFHPTEVPHPPHSSWAPWKSVSMTEMPVSANPSVIRIDIEEPAQATEVNPLGYPVNSMKFCSDAEVADSVPESSGCMHSNDLPATPSEEITGGLQVKEKDDANVLSYQKKRYQFSQEQKENHQERNLSLTVTNAPCSTQFSVAPTSAADNLCLLDILLIPGLINLCGAYFCVKMVRYTLIFWLPLYLANELKLNPISAGYTSMFFDCGGVAGSVVMGLVADRFFKGRGIFLCSLTCLIYSVVSLLFTISPRLGQPFTMFILFLMGFFVSSPDSSLAASLPYEISELCPYGKIALTSVLGMVGGSGSLGAIFQGHVTAFVSENFGWNWVFATHCFLMLTAFLTLSRCSKQCSSRKISTLKIDNRNGPPSVGVLTDKAETFSPFLMLHHYEFECDIFLKEKTSLNQKLSHFYCMEEAVHNGGIFSAFLAVVAVLRCPFIAYSSLASRELYASTLANTVLAFFSPSLPFVVPVMD